jgi:hypothetical protein
VLRGPAWSSFSAAAVLSGIRIPRPLPCLFAVFLTVREAKEQSSGRNSNFRYYMPKAAFYYRIYGAHGTTSRKRAVKQDETFVHLSVETVRQSQSCGGGHPAIGNLELGLDGLGSSSRLLGQRRRVRAGALAGAGSRGRGDRASRVGRSGSDRADGSSREAGL